LAHDSHHAFIADRKEREGGMAYEDFWKEEANRLIEESRALIAKIEELIAKSAQSVGDGCLHGANHGDLDPATPSD
jgi:hypothetical protein